MCGIAGIYSAFRVPEDSEDLVNRMNFIQKHRGPDDEGIYTSDKCVLGHRRLSIIDLSKDGHQPFHSDNGRFHLTYNGEIYNYIELRYELQQKGIVFKTGTDTEVLLKAYELYGKECLEHFNGMFAFAIYDSVEKLLFLARDRIGIKPLYYSLIDDVLYFASEIKAIRTLKLNSPQLNAKAVFDYLVFNRTDVLDETFITDISRLPKGHYAEVSEAGLNIIQWWNPEDYIESDQPFDTDEITKSINRLFLDSIKLRMRSDVVVGSCLSGGLDSSIIIGGLFENNLAGDQFLTFTSSFPGHEIDESAYVDNLNIRYPFINHRTFPNAQTAFDNLKRFIYMNDEPAFNPSFYSQYEVMRLARQNGVTVLLDGQGGDENFAGYHYFHGFNLYGLFTRKKYAQLIKELYKIFARKQHSGAYQTFLFQVLPDSVRKKLLLRSVPFVNRGFFYENIDNSIVFRDFFNARDLNQSLVRHFQFKLEHLLRMEDRNSMAFSIEARVPYLDHQLVEYLLSVPDKLKIKLGETKYLQKISLGQYTVPEILHRKDKIGFGTPRDEWMKEDFWLDLANQAIETLKSSFPGFINKKYQISDNGLEKWKLIQLALWNDIDW